MSMAGSTVPSGDMLASAELALGSTFTASWRRPLCLRGVTTSGRRITIGDANADVTRCAPEFGDGGGRVIASWQARGSENQASGTQSLTSQDIPVSLVKTAIPQSHGGRPTIGAALASWRNLDADFEDPDSISFAAEYFPIGLRQSAAPSSFLKINLREPDNDGGELIVLRGENPADEHQHTGYNHPLALFRPVPATSWEHTFWGMLPSFGSWFGSSTGPSKLNGIQIIRCQDSQWTRPKGHALFSLEDLHRTAAVHANTVGCNGGFLPGTPWMKSWTVHRIEEHCRDANLGFWGYIFSLKHSVLAVHLRCKGPSADGHAASLADDVLYLDKNADIGVSWRRAQTSEVFEETPREEHSFGTDMAVDNFWTAVCSTAAYSESQDRSNCQHFVRETFTELAGRGLLDVDPGRKFTLRNQAVANWLQKFSYLDNEFKMAAGNPYLHQAYRLFMSWDSKLGAQRLMTPWIERFSLRPASMTA